MVCPVNNVIYRLTCPMASSDLLCEVEDRGMRHGVCLRGKGHDSVLSTNRHPRPFGVPLDKAKQRMVCFGVEVNGLRKRCQFY